MKATDDSSAPPATSAGNQTTRHHHHNNHCRECCLMWWCLTPCRASVSAVAYAQLMPCVCVNICCTCGMCGLAAVLFHLANGTYEAVELTTLECPPKPSDTLIHESMRR